VILSIILVVGGVWFVSEIFQIAITGIKKGALPIRRGAVKKSEHPKSFYLLLACYLASIPTLILTGALIVMQLSFGGN
jgi:hypothetical protein